MDDTPIVDTPNVFGVGAEDHDDGPRAGRECGLGGADDERLVVDKQKLFR